MTTVVRGDFEWDPEKGEANLAKHGISFDEAVTVFMDPRALDIPDDLHPERLQTIGLSVALRVLLVVSTDRNDRIRIISARKATPAERSLYEEG